MGFIKGVLLALGLLFFGLFGFSCALIALLLTPVFPTLRFFSNSFFLEPFGWFARTLVGVKLTVLNRGRIHAARPAIFIGNHQTGLDLAVIGQCCPVRSVIVGKKELKAIPLFGWFFWIAGNLLIDRANKSSAKAEIERVRKKLKERDLNLAIFPEGTRSKTGEILPFKRGAFYLAVSTGYPIIPVVCSNLQGKGIWERFQLKGGNVVVSVLPPIETGSLNLSDLSSFSDQVRKLMVDEYVRVSALAEELDLR
ncbi:MAG: 1-acyl-sn-glycerol-3-phosphate acyltransferase [Bdellovibrionales bacterium]|nr:1-acyl-sn-glycerol-3-phosphate acyltransferase [Bdellovibrionales bacterium]